MKNKSLFIGFQFVMGVSLLISIVSCHSIKRGIVKSESSKQELVTGYYYLSTAPNKTTRQLVNTKRIYNLNPEPIITAKNYTDIKRETNNSGDPFLLINLDPPGAARWAEATGKSIGDTLAIVINDKLVHVAMVNAQITAPITVIWVKGLSDTQIEKYLADVKAGMNH